jgi:hypothetical protein
VSVRGQLKSIAILLGEAKQAPDRFAPDEAAGLAERLQEAHDRIERLPQISAVRPVTIALHNLIVSLRRPETSSSFADELDAAVESIGELLADPMLGISPDDLRGQIAAALAARGIQACVTCRSADLAFEPAYVLIKPFPSDPALAASQLPAAMVVCKQCGMWWMHDLAVLGLL